MPSKREENCPAVVVCSALNNARVSCWKGNLIQDRDEMMTQRCMAGIILLLAHLAGILPRVESVPQNDQKESPGGNDPE
jgi:hypothetical protein